MSCICSDNSENTVSYVSRLFQRYSLQLRTARIIQTQHELQLRFLPQRVEQQLPGIRPRWKQLLKLGAVEVRHIAARLFEVRDTAQPHGCLELVLENWKVSAWHMKNGHHGTDFR